MKRTERFGMGKLLGLVLLLGLSILPISAASAAPPLEVYGSLPAYEMARMSPSGNRVALLGLINGKRQMVVIENGTAFFTMPLGKEKVRRMFWAGENYVLILCSDTVPLGPGFTQRISEQATMQVVPLDGRPVWSVFANNSAVSSSVFDYYGAIARDGHWYGYFSGVAAEPRMNGIGRMRTVNTSPRSVNPSLFEVDLDRGRTSRIARPLEAEFGRRDWIIGADGKVAATLDFFAGSGSWSIKSPRHGEIAAGKAPFGGVALVAISPDGQGIVYNIDDAEDETGRYFVQPLAGGPASELLPGERFSSVTIDDSTRRIVGFTRAGDIPELHLLDPRQEKIVASARKAFPGVSFRLVDASEDFGKLLVETSGTGDPQSLWKVDIATGNADQIGAAYPVPSAEVGPVRMFDFSASDGLAMAGVLTLPPDRPATQLPLIMLPHGGPAARDHPVFDWWAQAFASRGYAVFQPNFRGSTELGAAFRTAGRLQWGRKMQSDLDDGLAALAKAGIVDPKRACIVGGSYGGYAALAGVTLQQNIYRCAVAVAGVADVARLASDQKRASGGNPAVRRWLRIEMGEGEDLKAISPINFADRVTVPVLLIHGGDDSVVPYEQSSEMANALSRAGKSVELIKLAGEDHWLSRGETRLATLKAMMTFVEKYNPPDPAPAAH